MQVARVKEISVGRSIPRLDSTEKVSGILKYFGDISIRGMLYGSVFRSPVPHAEIINVDLTDSLKLPGLTAGLTVKDILGANVYGPYDDAPILASKRVRYYGEPVAIFAAETPEAAAEAVRSTRFAYSELPVVGSIEESVKEKSAVHEKGNVAESAIFSRGSIEEAERSSAAIVENTYETGFQKHMYLEPEEGLAYYDNEGILTIMYGGQNPYGDRKVVARALNINENRVRVISYPTGGSFGGKEESAFPAHLALLAYYTKRPVGIFYSREESGIAGPHRHASKITLKTGADKSGHLTFNEARIYADTGAYKIWGPNVLDTIVETVNGPYRFMAVKLEGYLMYTNNGLSSAFRGFGAPQGNFAIESNMEELASELGIDPLRFRLDNLLNDGETAPLGNTARRMAGVRKAIEAAMERRLHADESDLPWYIKKGVGTSLGMKGVAYGGDAEDPSSAAVEIFDEGKVVVYFSNTDYGQGINTGHAQIAAEKLQIDPSYVKFVNADTLYSPDSGSSNASRSTVTSGKAIELACEEALAYLKLVAADKFGAAPESVSYSQGEFSFEGESISLFEAAALARKRKGTARFEKTYYAPKVDRPVKGMREAPRFFNSFALLMVETTVDQLLGKISVDRAIAFVDAGRLINPVIAQTQVEGAMVQGLGYALTEELVYRNGIPQNLNYTTYIVPTVTDVPKMEVEFVDYEEPLGPFGAKGVGEIGLVPVATAIANSIKKATGIRIRKLPLKPEEVLSNIYSEIQK
ncbi:MAG: xanthine dehydrogenase family protein [Nitrososphaerota archaeon]|jgi:CO/xanthine dehydrogenase Mo-binding subunit|nr:xanthine dehydrogenase family protein molybdopterin-binding subunit [Nitrososphaerota archaeon]MDG6931924.1 xanthine dehydrogenase family protein [Nitrososphaerota archaeon]MDG6943873.1 xanthine dehydrogenase family protein [Nitrososphaerota archaeon]